METKENVWSEQDISRVVTDLLGEVCIDNGYRIDSPSKDGTSRQGEYAPEDIAEMVIERLRSETVPG